MYMKTQRLGSLQLDTKVYFKITVTKTVWYWLRDTHVDGWSRMENLQIEIYKYGEMIFDKAVNTIQWR